VFLSDYNFDGSDSVIGGVSAYDAWSSLPEGNQSVSFQAQLHMEGVAELAGAFDFKDDFSAVNSPTGSGVVSSMGSPVDIMKELDSYPDLGSSAALQDALAQATATFSELEVPSLGAAFINPYQNFGILNTNDLIDVDPLVESTCASAEAFLKRFLSGDLSIACVLLSLLTRYT
jgi:hypothetical protein